MGQDSILIGVDLGTSYIKAAAFDLTGEVLARAQEKVEEVRTAEGGFLQPGDMIYEKMCLCLRDVTGLLGERAGQIRAVGFSGQMAGSIGVGENWEDVTSWSCTLDGRYMPYADALRQKAGVTIYRISGTGSPVLGAKYVWFKKAFPEEHKKIVKYTMLNGYCAGRLSGLPVEEAPVDYSLIAWTGLADLKTLSWSERLCGLFGVDMGHLPKIRAGSDVIGTVTSEAARLTGLPEGCALILGAGDKICGSAGALSLDEGDTMLELASYAAVNCRVRDYRPDLQGSRFDVIGSIDGSGYCAHKYLQGSGVTTDWFMDQFVRRPGDEEAGKDAFPEIEKLAAQLPPGSGHMLALGTLGGSAIPFDGDARGMFFGHTWASRKEHFYRALIEGFSYDLATSLEAIANLYPEYANRPLVAVGGGARSLIWPQILSDVTGREIRVLTRTDTGLLGAAKIAGVGAGLISGYQEPFGGVDVKQVFEPQVKAHRIYQEYMEVYRELAEEMSAYGERLAAIQ